MRERYSSRGRSFFLTFFRADMTITQHIGQKVTSKNPKLFQMKKVIYKGTDENA